MLSPWKKSYNKPRQHTRKQRHYFANKSPSSQSYAFSRSHVWMWELDYKESWAPKNWCFWIVVLEKTFESPWDCKEIKLVSFKENRSWVFIGRTDADASPDAKTLMLGKMEGRRRRGWMDEMVGWHQQLDGHEFGQALAVGGGQGSLACCSPWGRRVGHNWATELIYIYVCVCVCVCV